MTGRTRRKRAHSDNRPCVVRPMTITHVLTRVQLSRGALVTTLLRSIVRSARIDGRRLTRRFNRAITRLISNISGLSGLGFHSGGRTRTRGFQGVIVTVIRSVHIVLVGLTSHARGVHALNTLHPSGHHHVTHRALRVFSPLTRHLNVRGVGARLRRLNFRTLCPGHCHMLGGMMGSTHNGHGRVVRGVRTRVRNHLTRTNVGKQILNQRGGLFSVCRGVGGGRRHFRAVVSVCTFQIVASGISAYCHTLNRIRDVCGPHPNHVGSCVTMPGTGNCRSLRASVINPRNIPIRIRVHARSVRRVTGGNITTR